jgi:gas vesicle protein
MVNQHGSDAAGSLGWFLLGTVAGAAVALLLAPKTGEETREYIVERSGELLKKAQEKAGETQGEVGDLLGKGREYLEEQTQRLASAFEAGRAAMKEEISRARSTE